MQISKAEVCDRLYKLLDFYIITELQNVLYMLHITSNNILSTITVELGFCKSIGQVTEARCYRSLLLRIVSNFEQRHCAENCQLVKTIKTGEMLTLSTGHGMKLRRKDTHRLVRVNYGCLSALVP